MNDRERFEAWLKEDTTIELDDELADFAWYVWQAAHAESAARIAEIEQKLVEISSLMTLWKKGLLTGDELGKSLFVVHHFKSAITNTVDMT